MKHILTLLLISLATLMSCQKEEAIVHQQEVKFSLAIPATDNSSGRTNIVEPKSVLVTITDAAGNTIADREKIALYTFGDNHLSAPITLKTTGTSHYKLTEFMVMDANDQVLYATPVEGSALAHLVADPLAISFSVSKDQITTVTPEVLEVNTDTSPEEFGYGQFGFSIKETVSSIISAFIKGSNNFELTTAHLQVKGLRDTVSTDTTALWVYETELEAKANKLQLRKASWYALTISKEGYKTWTRILTLEEISQLEVILEQTNDNELNIMIAGHDVNMSRGFHLNNDCLKIDSEFLVNDVAYDKLSNMISVGNWLNSAQTPAYVKNENKKFLPVLNSANDYQYNVRSVAVDEKNTYHFAGWAIQNSITTTTLPVYWSESSVISLMLPEGYNGSANDIVVSGSNIYVSGEIWKGHNEEYKTPVFWKNNKLNALSVPGPQYSATWNFSKIEVSGNNIFIMGNLVHTGTSEQDAVLWKNEIRSFLTEPNNSQIDSYATDLSVESGLIAIAGKKFTRLSSNTQSIDGVYWLNGAEKSLEKHSAYDPVIDLHQGKVYVSGSQIIDIDRQTSLTSLWIDGKLTRTYEGTNDLSQRKIIVWNK
jgi:hypothetical protein